MCLLAYVLMVFNSDYFPNQLGLMQEDMPSTPIFSLYFNDCEMSFINMYAIPYEMKELNLFLPMYADDLFFSQNMF